MLQVSLLLLSFAGYYWLMHLYFRGRASAVYPALFASAVTLVGFVAGWAGVMAPAYRAVYYAGFLLLPVCAGLTIGSRRCRIRPTAQALLPWLLMVVGAYAAYGVMEGRFLYTNDDFSHWGRIAKVIATQLRFPTDADLLSHGSYPPGSALFIAYVSSIVGNGDGVWQFAQTWMCLSMWVSLLAASRRIVVQGALALLLGLFVNYSVTPEALTVDTLLASGAFACIMLCLRGKEAPDRFVVPTAVGLSMLVLIKNSGIFLMVLILLYELWLYRKQKGRLQARLLVLLLPVVVLLLWKLYVDGTYTTMMSHQISVDYYQQVFNGKTAADFVYILKLILSVMTDPASNYALWLIPAYLLALAGCKLQDRLTECRHVFVFAAILFIAYEAGILLMYVFSMPMKEIELLQGRDYMRYNNTIVAVLAAVLLYLAASFYRNPRGWTSVLRWSCGLIALLAATGIVGGTLLERYCIVRGPAYRISKAPAAYAYFQMKDKFAQLPAYGSYVVVYPWEDTEDMKRYMSRYYLWSKDVVLCADAESAEEVAASEPWRCLIDIEKQRIVPAKESVGVEIFANGGGENLLAEIGYKENTRYSTSQAADVTAYGWDLTGYIPAKAGDVINLQNVIWYPTQENGGRGGVCWFDAERVFRSNLQSAGADDLLNWQPMYDDSGNITQITVPEGVGSSTAYIRIVCQDIGEDSCIAVNE